MSTGVAVASGAVVLLGLGFILFWPRDVAWPRPRDLVRLLDKYGVVLGAAVVVLVLHLLLVAADARITEALGTQEELTAFVHDLEGGFVAGLDVLHRPWADVLFSVVYILFHPFVIAFTPILYLLSDDERAARAALLTFPFVYALSLPFYIFMPVTNVYVAQGLSTPVFELFPQLVDLYYQGTTPNNTFPSLHVALAILLWNASRYGRNRAYRGFLTVYMPIVVLGTLYLQIHYLLDVVGGVVVAGIVGVFTARVTATERLALRRVKPEPDEAQAVQDAAARLVARTDDAARDLGIEGKALLVGSVAKDTYLRDHVDLDVFFLMDPDVPRKELESAGLRLGRAVIPEGIEKFAEHPYVHGHVEGYPADIVPCYAVATAGERKSAVDRTPFHTRYVRDAMSREQRDDARLLKQFLRGVGVYGADKAVQGFSGYLAELLVLKFGSFHGVITAGARLRPGTLMTLERVEGDPRFQDPLVFLDPVDPTRNAASAVSAESLRRFQEAARAYLSRPGLTFFFPRQLVPRHPDDLVAVLARKRSTFLLVEMPRPDALEDHLHDQARKASRAVGGLLERHGFTVHAASYEVADKVRVLVEVAREELPEAEVHEGPPTKAGQHAERFRERWSDDPDALSPVWEDGGRLFVKRRRRFRRAPELVHAKARDLDLGKDLNEALRRGFSVEVGAGAVSEATARLFTEHLDPRKPWER